MMAQTHRADAQPAIYTHSAGVQTQICCICDVTQHVIFEMKAVFLLPLQHS